LLVPNYVEMVTPKDPHYSGQGGPAWLKEFQQIALIRLGDECRGQFGVTAMSGPDPLPERYLWELRSTAALSTTTSTIGALRIAELIKNQKILGGDLQQYFPLYWALFMNLFWPLYTTALIGLGLRLNKRDKDKLDPEALTRFVENFKRGRLGAKGWYERVGKLGITGKLGRGSPVSIRRDRRQFLEELAAKDGAAIFIPLRTRAPQILAELLQDLNSWKLATILEELILTQADRQKNADTIIAGVIQREPKIRVGTAGYATLRNDAQAEIASLASANLGEAQEILRLIEQSCGEKKRDEVLSALRQEKKDLLK